MISRQFCTHARSLYHRGESTTTLRTTWRHFRAYSSELKHDQRVSGAIKFSQVDALLAKPTWSVDSLLPSQSQALDAPPISPQQLQRLLRLSALPPPKTLEEEKKILDTLASQLHFVGEIQQVNTEGVQPLRAIRDETVASLRDQTVTMDTLKDAFAAEEVVGKHYKRIYRKPTVTDAAAAEKWDVLGSAQRKTGGYFVVESERLQK
ncbi:hypothetical protein BU24DRAFT_145634 [Aaosphaeria arxii CBS 175.79]|uniref:Glutamyl-tRNA amidotransferase complex subunit Gta3 domain-containing protein n=1 Tax=Aaosphaeria arxii CBS 175.79 TaxID=1450172 RepID=A0A6A5XW65_9PLEO|nr:uncharacterized protein BU24DRAFT_145634 [Aaosphaeria arxii CBS 175.79]KAF2017186.1 hypothetical protein BU24DRAFT_145634 [Aaosphaeria arxii CBS 175.79]